MKHDARIVQYPLHLLPEESRDALEAAEPLAAAVRYLPWHDRVQRVDEHLWSEAKRRLSTEIVTAVVNRQLERVADPACLAGYVRRCQATITAALLILGDARPIASEPAALLSYLSLDPGYREDAAAWIADPRHAPAFHQLAAWPGCAFLLLATTPTDCAESLLARDAFRAAMLGHA